MNNSQETIFIVDDSPANIHLLSSVLHNAGYTVRSAESGEDALISVQHEPPDLILLDVKMPGMDGYQVCKILKTNTDVCDIPIIFISGLTAPIDKVQAFACGGVDYIDKPINPDELLARVRNHLTISFLRQEQQRANEILDQKVRERTDKLSRANANIRLHRDRLESLLKLSQMDDASEQQLMDFALEEGVRLTQSKGGYLHFVHQDQNSLQLVAWSREVMRICSAETVSHYPLNHAGIWADCVRFRRPVIHNDYPGITTKKGMPEGHFEVQRHMSVPVFEGELIVAVAGVGNKETDYDESDVQQLSLFMNSMWQIVKRRRAEEKLRTLSQVVEQSPVSVMLTDIDGRIEYVNRSFEQVTGYAAADVINHNPKVLQSGETSPNHYREMWEAISSGKTWQGELQNRKKEGSLYWQRVHIAPVLNSSSNINRYLAIGEDITLYKQQEEKLLHQAHYDELTGLPNRLLAKDRLSQILKRAHRSGCRAAALFIDLDDFKKINDSMGHEPGDKILKEAGHRLRSVIREEDTVSRLGGDEFVVLLDNLADATDVQPVAESILALFEQPFVLDNMELVLTASIGIAIYPDDGSDVSTLLRNADTAMYQAKKEGRNTARYFAKAMNQAAVRRFQLEEQLRGALERRELYLHYQPIIDLSNCQIAGAEALLRWENPVLGKVSPEEFIRVAERTGLIVSIGDFVLKEALRQAACWRSRGSNGFRIAVNISPPQFRKQHLSKRVAQLLRRFELPGKCLELEITENVLMSGQPGIETELASLHELGVCIAMDDFGTGYSSLSYLRRYPFDTLKIDKSFVNDLGSDPAGCELVTATLNMAHGLGMKVVAEGVENKEQLAFLLKGNCQLGQGYFFNRPMPAADFENLLR